MMQQLLKKKIFSDILNKASYILFWFNVLSVVY